MKTDIKKLILPFSNNRQSEINMIVMHYISAIYVEKTKWDDMELILDIFYRYKVSVHYLITRRGNIFQFVEDDRCAWHAGRSEFKGEKHCNRFSLGIELVGGNFADFTDEQYESCKQLVSCLQGKYTIPADRILGHSDIAPDRKQDPGKRFDWRRIKS